MRRPISPTSRAARLGRGLWPDRNPLRRATDRAEAALVLGLLAAFLAGTPAAAAVAWHRAYATGVRTEQAELSARHATSAVLLQDAPDAAYVAYGVDLQVPARWTAPDGAPRTALVNVDAAARAGSAVMVWTDAAGRLTSAPLTREQVTRQAALAALTASAIATTVLLIAGLAGRRTLNRRRLAAWDVDWQATGPRWTSRR
jgi:hypothetical protein